MAPDRVVRCAWCDGELHIGVPHVRRDGYFLLFRRCRACDGANRIEIDGATAATHQHRRRAAVTRRLPVGAEAMRIATAASPSR
jgi:hypothetical protein